MKRTFFPEDPQIGPYLDSVYGFEDELLTQIRKNSEAQGLPLIQLSPWDARHIEILCRIGGVRKAIEIGTLGGYSGTQIARGLAPGGHLHTLEKDPEAARVAREHFDLTPLGAQVTVHVGDAWQTLPKLQEHGPFDLVFIDADKKNYPKYLEWASGHLRIGGFAILDNTFALGALAQDPTQITTSRERARVEVMKQIHEIIAKSPSFRGTTLPTSDGLSLAVRIQ